VRHRSLATTTELDFTDPFFLASFTALTMIMAISTKELCAEPGIMVGNLLRID
jgi:hypothetical protein